WPAFAGREAYPLILVLIAIVASETFFGIAVAGALDRGGCGAAHRLQQVRGNLFQKSRRQARLWHVVSIAAAVSRARHRERVHGAREAHVAEAAFLFHLVRIV